jgi:hypothetical protein
MSTVNGYYNHPHVRAQLFPNYDAARRAGFSGYDPGLGDFESELQSIFAAIPGAGNAYNDLVQLIQTKAKEGAEQAIPDIQAKVEATVKPYVIAALLIGFGGFLFGFSSYMALRRAA